MMMKNRPILFMFACVLCLTTKVSAQQLSNSPRPFLGYYYDYKIANPAFVGSKSKHLINTVYSGFPSVSNNRLWYVSYERNIATANSGLGGIFMHHRIGPETRVHAGLLYSYKLALSETSGIRFGTQLLYEQRHFDYDYYYSYVDPDDPLIPSGTNRRRSANFDLGVVYYSPVITVGVSNKNDRAHNYLNVVAFRKFSVSENLKIEPSMLVFTDLDETSVNVNSTFEIRKWLLLGAGITAAGNDNGDLTANVGVNIKDWIQIITHVYSADNEGDALIESMIRVTIPEKD